MDLLKSPGFQAILALVLAGGAFVGAGLVPASAVGLNLIAASLIGFATGRPMRAGAPLPGPTERNPEIPPPGGGQ